MEEQIGDAADNASVASVDSNGVRTYFYDPCDFDEEVFDLLKNNSSDIDAVCICDDEFNPLDINWGRKGMRCPIIHISRSWRYYINPSLSLMLGRRGMPKGILRTSTEQLLPIDR